MRSALFDRKVSTELFFDSDATADGVLLVTGVSAVAYLSVLLRIGVGAFSVEGLLSTVIAALVAWLILAGGTWVAATKLLDGDGQLQTMMRLHGHAELPLVLAAFGSVPGLIGLVWSMAAKVPATRESASLDTVKAAAALLVGFALVVLVRLVFQLPFMALSGLF